MTEDRQERPRALIIGHSFVRRFRDFLNGRRHNLRPISRDLNLDQDCKVYIAGISGRKVDQVNRMDMDKLTVIRPIIVVLEIGSNDLCDARVDPEVVAKEITDLVTRFKEEFRVEKIIVCAVLPRRRQPHAFYNEYVAVLNARLKDLLNYIPYATFWRHRGLLCPSIDIYHKDGIHLNTAGQQRLYRSYRGALIHALRRL